MTNVIVFGNVPLATWVVNELSNARHANLIGVVCDAYPRDHFAAHGMKEPSLWHHCTSNGIRILSFEEAHATAVEQPVLGISVRYDRLFKEEYFAKFRPGIINLHGGELPRYRGANIANYAILEGAPRGGGTLHFISQGIDEGDIVERCFFQTVPDETAFTFFRKTISALQEAFRLFLQKIDRPGPLKVEAIPQATLIEKGETARTYYKKGIEKYRYLDFEAARNWRELLLRARAFSFPGHKGAMLVSGEQSVELRFEPTGNTIGEPLSDVRPTR